MGGPRVKFIRQQVLRAQRRRYPAHLDNCYYPMAHWAFEFRPSNEQPVFEKETSDSCFAQNGKLAEKGKWAAHRTRWTSVFRQRCFSEFVNIVDFQCSFTNLHDGPSAQWTQC